MLLIGRSQKIIKAELMYVHCPARCQFVFMNENSSVLSITQYVLCRDCGEPLNFYRTPSVWKKHGKTHKVKEDPENYIATHGRVSILLLQISCSREFACSSSFSRRKYVVCDCGHPIHEDIGTSLTRSSRDSHNRSENHISWLALAKERSRG